MSQENMETVRRIFEAVAHQDVDVLEFYDREIEFDFSRSTFASVAGTSLYRGHEGLREFFRERHEVWEWMRDDLAEVIEAKDEVITVVTVRGKGRGSGIDAEQTLFAVWTIQRGKATRVRWFDTRADALAAVGRE
jgi:ketosteroid isomerase-like protein